MRRLWGCPLNATVLDTARMAAALHDRLRLARPPGQRPAASGRLSELARAYGLPVHPEHDPLHDAPHHRPAVPRVGHAAGAARPRHAGALRRLAGRT
jgi:hypothetical protein